MEFVAIDVEAANSDMASICQIGTAHFRDGTLVNENRFLINPKDYFDPINTGIHKIDESDVCLHRRSWTYIPEFALSCVERYASAIHRSIESH